VDPDAGLRPRRRRTPGIPSPGCGRASAAVPRPPGMRRASVAFGVLQEGQPGPPGGEREWGWRGPVGWELVGRAGGGGLVRFGCG